MAPFLGRPTERGAPMPQLRLERARFRIDASTARSTRHPRIKNRRPVCGRSNDTPAVAPKDRLFLIKELGIISKLCPACRNFQRKFFFLPMWPASRGLRLWIRRRPPIIPSGRAGPQTGESVIADSAKWAQSRNKSTPIIGWSRAQALPAPSYEGSVPLLPPWRGFVRCWRVPKRRTGTDR
jgi:hypothetical protein